MAKLNQNQEAVLNFLNNSNESFSATQVGVAVGKKNPKNASAWSKPILEELANLGLIEVETNGSKTVFFQKKAMFGTKVDEVVENEAIVVEEVAPSISDEEVIEMNQEEQENLASIFTEEEIEGALDAEDYTKEIVKIINEGSKLKDITEKEAYNEQLSEEIGNAIDAYENENGEIPTNFYNEVVKAVKKELKFTAPKKPHKPRMNIFTGVDRNEIVEVVKEALTKNEEAEADDKKPATKVVRETVVNFLEEEYGFSETSLEDKRTRAFIYGIKEELGLSNRPKDVVMATEEEFEKGQEVEFTAHRLTGRKGEVISGTVVRTFFNDFGFRYVVIKSDKKIYTKRDKNVVKK